MSAARKLLFFMGCCCALAVVLAAPGASATQPPAQQPPAQQPPAQPEALFIEAAQAIERGAYTEAIDRLELLADRGFVHPDASFNRGVAYLGRARSAGSAPGDRGRAVASFREALLLRPGDEGALALLDHVRTDLARERARTRSDQIESPRMARALVGLLPENTWALFAALFSGLTALGLGLRVFPGRRPRARANATALTGAILASVGGFGLLLTGSATAFAQRLRHDTEPAVVVVQSARLLDAQGRPLSGPPLPEGADVFLMESKGPLARVEQRAGQAWIRRSDLRTLASSDAR